MRKLRVGSSQEESQFILLNVSVAYSTNTIDIYSQIYMAWTAIQVEPCTPPKRVQNESYKAYGL